MYIRINMNLWYNYLQYIWNQMDVYSSYLHSMLSMRGKGVEHDIMVHYWKAHTLHMEAKSFRKKKLEESLLHERRSGIEICNPVQKAAMCQCVHLEHCFIFKLGSDEDLERDMWPQPFCVYVWFCLYTTEPPGRLAEPHTGWRFV